MNALVRRLADRQQYVATFFLRNRAELELMRRLADRNKAGASVNLTVLACSKGAEVYSLAWILRSARPDLRFHIHAIDISREILEFAENGLYSRYASDDEKRFAPAETNMQGDVLQNTRRDQNASIFARVTPEELEAMFEVRGDVLNIRPWLKDGITWEYGDAADPRLPATLPPQDFVMANRFLCHMKPPEADRCLRNIARLVKPGGFIFVTGVDLDIRTNVAQELGWKPVTELLREVHDGDPSLHEGWPLEYWSLEPFQSERPDWKIRYASVFQIGTAETTFVNPPAPEMTSSRPSVAGASRN